MFGVSVHSLLIHFPIVLAIVALVYDWRGFSSGDSSFHLVGSSLTKFAALSAVLATATGLQLAGATGLGGLSIVTGHAGFGIAATGLLAALAFMRYSAEVRDDDPRPYSNLWLAIQILATVLVATTAIIGHRI
jgi:uncharacterized membrane protein